METNKHIQDLDLLLKTVSEILSRYNIDHWLECGTLLGCIREETYLNWEYDIDLGAFKSDLKIFQSSDIVLRLLQKKIRCVIQDSTVTLWCGEKVYLDINFYHKDKNHYVMDRLIPVSRYGQAKRLLQRVALSPHYYQIKFELSKKNIAICIFKACIFIFGKKTCLRGSALKLGSHIVYRPWRVPKSIFNAGFKFIYFRGVQIKIPIAAEEYLCFRYGENWMTPNKSWSTELQDGSIVKV